MAIMDTKNNEPLIPFLQPVWTFRASLNEVLVDAMGEDSHRRSARLLLYSAAVISGMARFLGGSAFSGGIELVLSLVLAGAVLRVVEPIIKFRHDMKYPEIAVTPYIGILGLVIKLIVGIRVYAALNAVVRFGEVAQGFGTLVALVLFQMAMVVVLDDGERPLRRVLVPVH